MHAIKRKNPLTESFLVQLDVDLEGAGLDSTSELRASVPLGSQRSTAFAASQGCPNTAVRDGDAGPSARPPTYGDVGLAAYNDPNAATSIPVTTDAPVKGSTFGAYSVPGLRGQSNGLEGFQPPGNAQFELQNRQQRSPGSQQSSGISPRPYNPDMDTSPDGSGGNDRPTPNSSTHSQHNYSSHTSNSTHSPPIMQQPDMTNHGMTTAANLFDQSTDANATFTTDFDMHNFAHPQSNPDQNSQQPGFVMWDGDLPADMHTGFTPGPSSGFTPGLTPTMGFTPGESGAVNEVGGMNAGDATAMGDSMNGWSEADFNDFMASMNTSGGGGQEGGGGGWDTNVEHSMQDEAVMHERLAKRGLVPRQWPGGR